jgi:hypothetical protein
MGLQTVAESLQATRRAYLKTWLELETLKSVQRLQERRFEMMVERLQARVAALERHSPSD